MLADLFCAASKVGVVVLATVFGLPYLVSAPGHVIAPLFGVLQVVAGVVWASVLSKDPTLALGAFRAVILLPPEDASLVVSVTKRLQYFCVL